MSTVMEKFHNEKRLFVLRRCLCDKNSIGPILKQTKGDKLQSISPAT